MPIVASAYNPLRSRQLTCRRTTSEALPRKASCSNIFTARSSFAFKALTFSSSSASRAEKFLNSQVRCRNSTCMAYSESWQRLANATILQSVARLCFLLVADFTPLHKGKHNLPPRALSTFFTLHGVDDISAPL